MLLSVDPLFHFVLIPDPGKERADEIEFLVIRCRLVTSRQKVTGARQPFWIWFEAMAGVEFEVH